MLWRLLIFGPFFMTIGFLAFLIALFVVAAPFVTVVVTFLEGNWITGSLILLAWLVTMRWIMRFFSWLMQGYGCGL